MAKPNSIPPSLAEKRKATSEDADASSNLMNLKKSKGTSSSDEETGRIDPDSKPKIQISPCFLPSDVTLVVEDQRLYVNKDLLSSASPVFETWLKKEWQENDTKNEFKFPHKTYEEMNTFLKCLLPICDDQVTVATLEVVLPLADEYQTERLVKDCEEVINNHVESVSNRDIYIPPSRVVTYLHWIDKYNLKGLETSVVRLASFLKTEELEKVSDYENVCLRIQRDIANARVKLLDNIYVSKLQEIEKKMYQFKIPLSSRYMTNWKQDYLSKIVMEFLATSTTNKKLSSFWKAHISIPSTVAETFACISICDRFNFSESYVKAFNRLYSLDVNKSDFRSLWSKHYSTDTENASLEIERHVLQMCHCA